MNPTPVPVATSDGRQLDTFTWGREGRELVVFEAGLGASGRSWGLVAERLPLTVRSVAYDRAGLGGSSVDRAPRTLDRLAGDLITVVEAQGQRPVMLVGHSWGGPVVRRVAQLRPDLVSAMVLVDPSDEGDATYFSRGFAAVDRLQRAVLPWLGRTGLAARLMRLVSRRAGLPEADAREVIEATTTPQAMQAIVAEDREIRAGLWQLREHPDDPQVPVVVISGVKDAHRRTGRRGLLAAHEALVARLADGRHVRATESQHWVPFTEPEVVAEAVVGLLGH